MWTALTSTPLAKVLATACAALALASCHARQPIGAGVYSNMEADSESTDAGGIEIDLRRHGGAASAMLVVCEGGCWGAEARRVEIDGATVVVSWRHPLHGTTEEFVLQGADDGLLVTEPSWAAGWRLNRVPRPEAGRTEGWAAHH